ncbi:hypothetical protein Cni_G16688 [Canna indica]|uniref:AB hydrolase-1 domain-containing protein n=1 Tax=Canna indica TaxID=4628 RepID=A0AAQ3KFK0_9LILI|nr:hypothetical protein Cni_G16688 [Canna indica]
MGDNSKLGDDDNSDHFNFRCYTTLDAYVDDLGVESCFFIGHSFSAMVGILAAIRRPELFLRLILIGASPKGFELEDFDKVFAVMEANYEVWV